MWNENKTSEILISFLVLLLACGFMNQASNILVVVFIILVMEDRGKLYLNYGTRSFYLLTLFAISYFFFMQFHDMRGIIAIGCPLAYYIGVRADSSLDNAKKIILLLAFGMAAHVLLNIVYEYSMFGSAFLANSRHYDIWGQALSTATGIMTNATLFVGLTYYWIFLEKRFWLKWFGIAVLATLTVYDLALGGRTYLFLMVISIVLGMLLNVILSGMSRQMVRTIGKILFIGFIALIIFCLIYLKNQETINSFFEDSYFYHRFFRNQADQKMFETPRTERIGIYISTLSKYFWGGDHAFVAAGGRSHTLWLDTFDQAGVITFIFLVLYSIAGIIRGFKVISNPYIDMEFKVMVCTLLVAIFAQFCVEPVLIGAPTLLFSYCIIDGVLTNVAETGKELNGYESDIYI